MLVGRRVCCRLLGMKAFAAFADLMAAGHAPSIGVVLQYSRFRELFPNVPLHFH